MAQIFRLRVIYRVLRINRQGVKQKIPAVCHVAIEYDHLNLSTV